MSNIFSAQRTGHSLSLWISYITHTETANSPHSVCWAEAAASESKLTLNSPWTLTPTHFPKASLLISISSWRTFFLPYLLTFFLWFLRSLLYSSVCISHVRSHIKTLSHALTSLPALPHQTLSYFLRQNSLMAFKH